MIDPELIERFKSNIREPAQLESALEELVQEFRSIEVNFANVDVLSRRYLAKIGIMSTLISSPRAKEQWYFRARPDTGFDPSKLTEFGAPPLGVGSLGRCNLAGSPVFYGSELAPIALDETNINAGETAYLSLWRSHQLRPVYAMIRPAEDSKTDRFNFHAARGKEQQVEFSSQFPPEIAAYVEKVFEIERQLFRGNSDYHKVSAVYSHRAVKESNVDGLQYPDAKTGVAYNFALTPEFAAKLELHAVYKIKRQLDGWAYLRFGKPLVDGRVGWRDPLGATDSMMLCNDPALKGVFSDVIKGWNPKG